MDCHDLTLAEPLVKINIMEQQILFVHRNRKLDFQRNYMNSLWNCKKQHSFVPYIGRSKILFVTYAKKTLIKYLLTVHP
jgi:hypothetical protein